IALLAGAICVAAPFVRESRVASAEPSRTARRVPARAPQAYAQTMTGMHASGGRTGPLDTAGRPMLVFRNVGRNERVELVAATDRGGFSAFDLDRAAH